MSPLILLFGPPLPFLCFAVVVVVAMVLLKRFLTRDSNFPYRKAAALFTPAEKAFLIALDQAAADQYRVFGKVRLGDIIDVAPGLSFKLAQPARNRINRKHVDFVLCRKTDYSIAFAVELDDKSHDAPDRRRRDEFVDAACKAAGVKLLHFPAKSSYDVQKIRKALAEDLPNQPL
jgi:hypothetical protein